MRCPACGHSKKNMNNHQQSPVASGARKDKMDTSKNPDVAVNLADAAHIVRCVNSHDALVEALRACVALLADDISDEQNAALYAAERALAMAKQ